MRRFLLWWWLPLLLPASFVYAEACRVGAVLRVVGDVTMQRQARSFMPFSGLQVCRGDRFVTGPGGIAEVRLRDGSLITVGRSSEFVIRDTGSTTTSRMWRSSIWSGALFAALPGRLRRVRTAMKYTVVLPPLVCVARISGVAMASPGTGLMWSCWKGTGSMLTVLPAAMSNWISGAWARRFLKAALLPAPRSGARKNSGVRLPLLPPENALTMHGLRAWRPSIYSVILRSS